MDLRSIIAKSKRPPKVSAIIIEHGSQQDVTLGRQIGESNGTSRIKQLTIEPRLSRKSSANVATARKSGQEIQPGIRG
ncbi:hypothetical protein Q31b_56920 [Novipirellula aureliae]|uniref:Uncharacterized protein n=1 Tax=Novipirellula aureliae TaxID=2527966 RepID=A0A5C6DBR2_9BACT|nr:hypothetical protein Q31b_56920 [Novipirellula aureliae]